MMKTKISLLKKLKKRESNYFKNWRKKKEKRKILAEKKGNWDGKRSEKNKVTEEELWGRLNKLNSDFAKISEIRKTQWKEKD